MSQRVRDRLMVLYSSICHNRDTANSQEVKDAYNDCLRIIYTDVKPGCSGVWLTRHVRNSCLFPIEMKSTMGAPGSQEVKNAYRSVFESLNRSVLNS